MAKKQKRRYKFYRYHVIGKYIDTPTKAELPVVFYVKEVGTYKISGAGMPPVELKGCRIQIKRSDIKRKAKFAKQLQPYLDISTNWKEASDANASIKVPLIFGLLKLRKGKERKFILFQATDIYYKSKVVTITAVGIDNLMYLDLVSKCKTKP
jgi:hypothetical protein